MPVALPRQRPADFLNVGTDFGALGDGVTDDTAAFTAALGTPNRVVSLTYGATYLVSASIPVAANVVIDFNGATVKVKDGTTLNGGVFQSVNRIGVEIRGGTIDLNKALTTNPAADTAGMAIYFAATTTTGTRRCRVSRMVVVNGHRKGIYAGSGTDGQPNEVTVEHTTVTDCNEQGIYVTRPTRFRSPHNTLERNCASVAGAGQLQVVRGSNVLDVDTVANGAPAGLRHGKAFSFVNGLRVIGGGASDNSTDTGGADGSGVVVSEECTNFVISGGIYERNGAMGITVDVKRAPPDETIFDTVGSVGANVCSANGSHGIYCQYAKGVSITGNTCEVNNGDGISVVSREDVIAANSCRRNNGVGLRLGDSATATAMGNNTVASNRLDGNTGGDFSDTCTLRNRVDQLESGIWTPRDHGLRGWSHDPAMNSGSAAPAAGVMYAMRVMVIRDGPAGPVWYMMSVAGSGAQLPANCWVGLFSLAGTRLGVSADQSTAMQATGPKSAVLTVDAGQSLALLAGSYVWLAFVIGTQSTTPAQLSRAGAGTTTQPNVNLTSASPFRSLSSGSAQTALPASFTPSTGTANVLFWMGLS